MTGAELFEALSFVDEKYVQEAENAKLRTATPWMKVLSVAACLCILITGVYAYSRTQSKSAMESMVERAPMAAEPEAAAPAEAEQEEISASAAPKQESTVEESVVEGASGIAAGELVQIPYAQLRIVKVLEEGSFEVIVVADESMEMDTPVKVVVDPSKVPCADAEIQNDLSRIKENTSVVVENGAYDAQTNTLYVAEMFLLREAE